jgi:hypothetical protein
MPRIRFNYGKADDSFNTPQQSLSSTLHHSVATPHFALPLCLIAENRTSVRASKRMTFSDKHE